MARCVAGLAALVLAASAPGPMAQARVADSQTQAVATPTITPKAVRPPGTRPAAGSTEESLWVASADAEREAGHAATRIEDVALQAYLRGVQCRVAPAYCEDLRLGVFRRPAFNATVMPNGYTEVWSGLLLRVENEAQLAFVLGHEFAHFRGNHSLQRFEDIRARQGALMALSFIAATAATFDPNYIDYAAYADILQSAAYLGQVAAMLAYGRDHEREADFIGQQMMAEAGYDPAEAAPVWTNVIVLQTASDNLERRREVVRGGIFRTHPVSTERLASLRSWSAGLPATGSGGDVGADRLRAAIRPFLNDWLRDEIRRRDYGATLALLAQLGKGGDPGLIGFYQGEVYRLRRADGDGDRALAAYRDAVTHADVPPEAWREYGLALNRADERAGAAQALARYLELAPAAADAVLVRRTLERLHAPVSGTQEGRS